MSNVSWPLAFLDLALLYLSETREDQQIHCILTFDGRFDFILLERAVRLSIHAEPILRCRLVHTEDAAASVEAFLTSPLDPFVDPLV